MKLFQSGAVGLRNKKGNPEAGRAQNCEQEIFQEEVLRTSKCHVASFLKQMWCILIHTSSKLINVAKVELKTEHSLPAAMLRIAGALELKLSSDFGGNASDRSDTCCRHLAIGIQRSL